jgi:hypothetical protein
MGLKQAFLCAIVIVLPWAAHAMNVEVHGDTVYASGPVENDFGKFQDAFDKSGVAKVVFVNSPGCDLWTGMSVGRLIAQRGLSTVIARNCTPPVPSCSWVAKSALSLMPSVHL